MRGARLVLFDDSRQNEELRAASFGNNLSVAANKQTSVRPSRKNKGEHMIRRWLIAVGVLVLVPCLSVSAQQSKKGSASKPTVAVFRLHGSLSETPADDGFPFGGGQQISFKELVTRLKKAGSDPAVKAIVLLSEGEAAGTAQTEELRQVMSQVRTGGKDIFVHADSISMREYVLFAGATRISLVPTGDVWVTGLKGESP